MRIIFEKRRQNRRTCDGKKTKKQAILHSREELTHIQAASAKPIIHTEKSLDAAVDIAKPPK